MSKRKENISIKQLTSRAPSHVQSKCPYLKGPVEHNHVQPDFTSTFNCRSPARNNPRDDTSTIIDAGSIYPSR